MGLRRRNSHSLRVDFHYRVPTNFARADKAEAIGTLRSNDADGNANVIKTIGLISKTTTLHVHHTFFVHFFHVFARLRRENA